jgi:hypothetical protein
MRRLRSLDDLDSWFRQPCIGTVETGAAKWWRLVQQRMPSVRTVVLRRDPVEVRDSMIRLGFRLEPEALLRSLRLADMKLDQIERRVPGVLSVRFGDIMTEVGAAQVFEHCLGLPFDAGWFETIRSVNIQSDMRAMLRYMDAYMPELVKLAKTARHRIVAGMQIRGPEIPGMTIAEEPFDDFFRDGPHLFSDHLIQVGEAPDNYRAKNIPLMRRLSATGLLQVVVARTANKRMAGYLMTTIGPSLESADITTAIHGTFYADPDYPGLGMKMQRVAAQVLREKNVTDLYFRAGVRGDGPRTDVIARRLGAEDDGHLYVLHMSAH